MEGLQKSKRVSWASDINLSEVKFYFTDESPSRIGLSGEDDLQVQTLWDQQSVETGIDLNFPPKIDEFHSISFLKNKISQIPLIKWSCPPKLMLERIWRVGSGEESLEVEEQYQRESGIPETIYYPGSIVPSNPSMLMDIDNEDNQNSPFEIPINLIEDEELDHMDSTNLIDFATAACKVLTSIVPSGDEDSNMDPDELFKALTNPIIVGNLIKLNEATSTSLVVSSDQITNHSQKRMGEPLTNVRPLSKRKDDNDYKTFVEKHGGERRDDNGGERKYDNGVEKYGGERRYDNGGERRYDNGGERRRYGNGGERRRRRRRNDNGGERRRYDNGGERRRNDNGGGGRYGGRRRESSSSNDNDYRRRGTKSCSFYNTLVGCRNGDNCNFKHDSSSKDRT
ncbi:zinc finger CCCH domain-containing protein 6-like [Impatiens glandulifera]|uniref:zinc finger CCCH domain-containing protein 6-like n=1 Tax=Impatiens glandulifera TaxID=253017 RepID=UPI001FB16CAA|nr:zinc finger CCCH domain-containing protein 6-like [Impatiens glandulifera]